MTDIMLDENGDVKLSEGGDISIAESVRQSILVRLRWIYNEWRLGPELGFPFFEEVFIKNPNIEKLRILIRNAIMEVDEITDASVDNIAYDKQKRSAYITYTAVTTEETFKEEVTLYG